MLVVKTLVKASEMSFADISADGFGVRLNLVRKVKQQLNIIYKHGLNVLYQTMEQIA